MIRALPLILLVVVVLAVGSWVIGWARAAVARRPETRGSARPGGFPFDGRIQALRGRSVVAPRAAATRGEIEEFLRTHDGVEAYVEPETVLSPRSAVFVDAAGEWRRFPVPDDAALRRLSNERGVPIFDAARTGYPSRMRRRPGTAT